MNIDFGRDPTLTYVVWIITQYGPVDAYQVTELYPEGKPFQYQPRRDTGDFGAEVNEILIAVSDSLGQANTSKWKIKENRRKELQHFNFYAFSLPLFLAVNQTIGTSKLSKDQACPKINQPIPWLFVADIVGVGENATLEEAHAYSQCSELEFYPTSYDDPAISPPPDPIPPFTITFLPVERTPVTVTLPASASNVDDLLFYYTSILPFKAGTMFQVLMGDAKGGATGGFTPLSIVAESNETFCLEEGYQQLNADPLKPLPVSGLVAEWRDLKPFKDNSNRNSIIGGVIGGAVAAGILLTLLAVFLFHRRKKIKARDEARKEENRFMDLDGDEDGNTELGSRGRKDGEMSQT